MAFEGRLSDYNDVSARIVEFREKYPKGSLQPINLAKPYHIETIGNRIFIVYVAAAYRDADDRVPGVGVAWEPFPGRTPYTENSELMNAETSAWGRAIVAALAADTKRGIATREDVRNRQADQQQEAPRPAQAAEATAREALAVYNGFLQDIRRCALPAEVKALGGIVQGARDKGRINATQYDRLTQEAAKKIEELEQK